MASPPTKLPPNEFTRPILKARGPRRGARDPGGSAHGPAAQLQRLGTVTPATSPLAWTTPTPTEPRQN